MLFVFKITISYHKHIVLLISIDKINPIIHEIYGFKILPSTYSMNSGAIY